MATLITGRCVRYGIMSGPIEGSEAREVIGAGAFDEYLGTTNISINIDHDGRRKLGSTKRGNLRVWADPHGVLFEVLAEPPYGWSGVSFTFSAIAWKQIGPAATQLVRRPATNNLPVFHSLDGFDGYVVFR